jgi:hypothetical protein
MRYGPKNSKVSHHIPPNEKRQPIKRLRNGAGDDAESSIKHEVQRLRGGADESTANYDDEHEYQVEQYDESQLQYDDTEDDHTYQQVTVDQGDSIFDPNNIFSMKLDPTIPGVGYGDEFDNFPDPRLYNVDMKEMILWVYIFIHMLDDDNNHPFFNYERYLQLVDHKMHIKVRLMLHGTASRRLTLQMIL